MPFIASTIHYIMGSNPVWFFVDETGQIAVGATMGTFSGSNHATPKAVYMTDDNSAPWPNPIPMNTTGAAPLYFTDDDPNGYYLVVMDAQGNVLWTIDKYLPPSSGGGGGGGVTVNNYFNILPNPQFQFDYGSQSGVDFGKLTPVAVAQGPWKFVKNGSGSNDHISFVKFSLGDTVPEGTPVQYINLTNGQPGSSETYRYLEYFMPNVRILEQQQVIAQFSGFSTENSNVAIQITQFFGTGGSPSNDVDIILGSQTFTLTGNWTGYYTTGTLPTVLNKSIGTNGDDGVYFRFLFKSSLDSIYQVGLTNVQFRLGNQQIPFPCDPTPEDISYTMASQIPDAKNGPVDGSDIGKVLTVGNARLYWGVSSFPGTIYPWGAPKANAPTIWTYCDGARYDIQANFSDNIPCSRLGNILQLPSNAGPVWGNGYDYLWCNAASNIIQVLNADGGAVGAIANGTPSPGFTINTLVPGVSTNYGLVGVYYQISQPYIWIWTDVNKTVSLPTSNALGTLYVYADANTLCQGLYKLTLSGTISTFNSKYFFFDGSSANYYVWINYNGTGVDPAPAMHTGIEVNVTTTDTLYDVTLKIIASIRGAQLTYLTAVNGSAIPAGSYLTMEATGQKILPWFKVDGAGTAPSVAGYTNIEVDVSSSDTSAQIATKYSQAVNNRYFAVPDGRGGILMGLPDGTGIDPGVINRFSYGNPGITGDSIGTYQFDQNRYHDHSEDGTDLNYLIGGTAGFDAHIVTDGDGYFQQALPADGQPRATPYNLSVYYFIAH